MKNFIIKFQLPISGALSTLLILIPTLLPNNIMWETYSQDNLTLFGQLFVLIWLMLLWIITSIGVLFTIKIFLNDNELKLK